MRGSSVSDCRFRLSVRVAERTRARKPRKFPNWANFGGPGHQLSGILDGAPGSSLNNASSAGYCGNSTNYCTSRSDRILPGSGTYSNGAPRQMEFGVRVTF